MYKFFYSVIGFVLVLYGGFFSNMSSALAVTSNLTVITKVINDDGGTKTSADFIVEVNGANATPNSFFGSEAGTLVIVDAGAAYITSVVNDIQYFALYSSDCSNTLLAGVLATCTITMHDYPTPMPAGNLVINPSLETVDGDEPLGWSKGAVGTVVDPIFTYPVQGMDDAISNAARVEMLASGGDAKWYFDYVDVSPNSDYVYRARYRSNVVTRVAVAEGNATQTVWTYLEALNNVSASEEGWGQVAIEIHTKPTTEWLSVYHLIENVGWLEIDRVSLVTDEPILYEGMIPNNSVEQISTINNALPRLWNKAGWGNNTRTFEYVSGDAHTGDKSVKLTISNYVDGDAKWMYTPQTNLTPGADYRFKGWYKARVGTTPRVVAQFKHADNSYSFFGMPNPLPGSDSETVWQEYKGEFSVPTDVVDVSIFFFLKENGWIQTDDYFIEPYTYVGFNRPLITLTFDDGAEENVSTVLPVLNTYNFKTTQCFNTQYFEGLPAQEQLIIDFYNAGHEVCAHTITHRSLVTLNETELVEELVQPQDFLDTLTGAPVTSFASPYGDYNSFVLSKIDDYYEVHRTVDQGFNSKDNLNVYRLRVQNMKPTTTLVEFQGWVDKAITDKTWLILVYHKVTESTLLDYDTSKADFDLQMSWLNNKVLAGDITIKRLDDAIVELTTISATSSGGSGGSGSTYIPPIATTTPTTTLLAIESKDDDTDSSTVEQDKVKVLGVEFTDVMTEEYEFLGKIDMNLTLRLAGRILLQVERYGQAWYLEPLSLKKYYLANGTKAYDLLRKFGLGISNKDLAKIPVGYESRFEMFDTDTDGLPDKLEEALGSDLNKADTDGDGVNDGKEVLTNNTNPLGAGKMVYSSALANRLKGRILLQVESRGEAWYVNPVDGKRYYMHSGEAAFQIMRYLSLGINNDNLRKIPLGDF